MPTIQVELTEAQHAAAATLMGADSGYDLASFLADLPIVHSRMIADLEDEGEAYQRYADICTAAVKFASLAFTHGHAGNVPKALDHADKAMAAEANADERVQKAAGQIALHFFITASKAYHAEFGEPSAAGVAAEERLIERLKERNDE